MRLTFLQRAAHGFDLARQIGPAESLHPCIELVYVRDDDPCDLTEEFSLFLIVTKQKILFGAPALKQFNLDFLAQLEDGPRLLSCRSVHGDFGFGVHVDAANKGDPGNADNADRRNLVRQPRRESWQKRPDGRVLAGSRGHRGCDFSGHEDCPEELGFDRFNQYRSP
jgi:hypothetical protein